jgi:hypothetical protein
VTSPPRHKSNRRERRSTIEKEMKRLRTKMPNSSFGGRSDGEGAPEEGGEADVAQTMAAVRAAIERASLPSPPAERKSGGSRGARSADKKRKERTSKRREGTAGSGEPTGVAGARANGSSKAPEKKRRKGAHHETPAAAPAPPDPAPIQTPAPVPATVPATVPVPVPIFTPTSTPTPAPTPAPTPKAKAVPMLHTMLETLVRNVRTRDALAVVSARGRVVRDLGRTSAAELLADLCRAVRRTDTPEHDEMQLSYAFSESEKREGTPIRRFAEALDRSFSVADTRAANLRKLYDHGVRVYNAPADLEGLGVSPAVASSASEMGVCETFHVLAVAINVLDRAGLLNVRGSLRGLEPAVEGILADVRASYGPPLAPPSAGPRGGALLEPARAEVDAASTSTTSRAGAEKKKKNVRTSSRKVPRCAAMIVFPGRSVSTKPLVLEPDGKVNEALGAASHFNVCYVLEEEDGPVEVEGLREPVVACRWYYGVEVRKKRTAPAKGGVLPHPPEPQVYVKTLKPKQVKELGLTEGGEASGGRLTCALASKDALRAGGLRLSNQIADALGKAASSGASDGGLPVAYPGFALVQIPTRPGNALPSGKKKAGSEGCRVLVPAYVYEGGSAYGMRAFLGEDAPSALPWIARAIRASGKANPPAERGLPGGRGSAIGRGKGRGRGQRSEDPSWDPIDDGDTDDDGPEGGVARPPPSPARGGGASSADGGKATGLPGLPFLLRGICTPIDRVPSVSSGPVPAPFPNGKGEVASTGGGSERRRFK